MWTSNVYEVLERKYNCNTFLFSPENEGDNHLQSHPSSTTPHLKKLWGSFKITLGCIVIIKFSFKIVDFTLIATSHLEM